MDGKLAMLVERVYMLPQVAIWGLIARVDLMFLICSKMYSAGKYLYESFQILQLQKTYVNLTLFTQKYNLH